MASTTASKVSMVEAWDIGRQFDDPLVVDVVQHENRCPGRRSERPWRLGFIVLYMDRNGRKTARPFAEACRNGNQFARQRIVMGLRRPAAKPPRLPGDTPVLRAGRTEKTWTH